MHILNDKRLREITGGDAEIEKQLYGLVIGSVDDCLDRLAAVVAGSAAFSHWSDICHELKGASANVGAEILQDKAKAAEFAPQAEIAVHFDAIKAAAEELKKHIESKVQ